MARDARRRSIPHKWLVLICINLANLVCHAVYSVLAAFFPQEAAAKGMGDDATGIIFATFAAVIFLCSPWAGRLMTRYGKVRVYISGLLLVSVSTIFFSMATWFSAGTPFAAWCLCFRVLQGIGSAMEETAAYAIIVDIDTENVSFFLGICEISTGLGYMARAARPPATEP
jgi:MFS family permease